MIYTSIMTNTKKPGRPEKVERNTEIYKKKQAGVTYRQLVVDYGLAQNTVYKIVERYRNKYGH